MTIKKIVDKTDTKQRVDIQEYENNKYNYNELIISVFDTETIKKSKWIKLYSDKDKKTEYQQIEVKTKQGNIKLTFFRN